MNDLFTAGIKFSVEGEAQAEKALESNRAATEAYAKAQDSLSKRIKVSVDSSNKKAKSLSQLDTATKRAENQMKQLAASVQSGAITSKQYQSELNKISAGLRSMGLENAQSKVLSYGRSTFQATKTTKEFEAAQKALAQAKGGTVRALNSTTTATNKSTREIDRVRQAFLGTANSIAILDGPLGGVASRFSAFGVLIGRTGLVLGAFTVGISALSFAAQRAIREFAEFEVQVSTLENRLSAAGNQINLTSEELVNMADKLGMTTLMDEREVMRAAGQLLTFRNITTEVFDDVLKSAADLAASGFGTLESETIKLAKALEDPRQSLTALSRAGIVFTRQQRNMIISMADAGREAEAMALILQNVDRQVGGAAEAQARDTLAGSFDTIGQAVRTATREFGEFVSQEMGVRRAIGFLAERAGEYIDSTKDTSPQQQLKATRQELERLNSELDNSIEKSTTLSSAFLGRGQRFTEDLVEQIRLRNEEADALERLVHFQETSRAIEVSESGLGRRQEAITDLQAQIDLQRESIGLTQEQERVMRAMAAVGLGGDVWANINRELREYRANLEAAGVSESAINRALEVREQSLRAAKTLAEEWAQAMTDAATARQVNQLAESTESNNELMRIQIRILEESRAAGERIVTVTEAARLAQVEKNKALLEEEAQKIRNKEETGKLAEADVARLNVILATLAALKEQEASIKTLADFSRDGAGSSGGGGGGGGKDPNAEYQRELDSLNTYLERRREEMMIANGLERELLVEQYEERFQTLNDALERKLLSEQEYADKVVELTQSREDRIRAIEEASARSRLSFTAGILGDMAGAMQSGGDKMVKIAAGIAFAQGVINAHLAYTQALADPTIPSTLAKIGFAAKVFGLGMNAANAIRGAGGSGGGGASGRTANAPREARELAPQRVLIQGLDPQAFYTGEQLTQLFEAFYSENDNRGRVFVVNQ